MPASCRSLSVAARPLALALAATALSAAATPLLAADQIDEIVVTVRQRAESVKDVPGSVDVLSAKAIEDAGVERARDFIALTPGVSIVNAAEVADSQVNIRGINGARDAETNYALVIDGILMTNPAALNREYTNLQQIEVLKGPQGAIYGRNAAAGAFIITTKKPGDTLSGNVKASAAQDDTYLLSGNIGGPLGGAFKWGLEADYRDSNGYYKNKDTGNTYSREYYPDPGCDDCVDYFEGWDVAGRLIWDVSPNASLDTKIRYGEVDAGSISFNSVFQLPVPLQFGFNKAFYEDVNDHPFGFNPNVKPYNDQQSFEISSKLDYDLGWADLTAWGLFSDIENDLGSEGTSGAFGFFWGEARCQASTAALQGFPVNPPQVIGATPAASILGAYTPTTCDGTQYQQRDQKDYSFEVRLASKSDQRLRWLGGLYYLNIDREVAVNTGLDTGTGVAKTAYTAGPDNPTQQLLHDQFKTDVYAVFGQLAYDVTDTVEASLALRYDREEREVHNKVPTGATTPYIDTCLDGAGVDPINPGLCGGASIPDKEKTFEQLEPKFALTWDATEAVTGFASIGVGFKSGGFNSQGSKATIDGFINNAVVAGFPAFCGDNSPCTRVNIADDYKKETSLAFEVGAKSTWLDNRLRVNAAYYYTTVDDMQFFEFYVGPFGLLRVVSNIDEVNLYGVEASVNWVASDWLELYAGANITHSNIEKNSVRPDTVGNESPYTPDWTGNLGARFSWPIASTGLDFIANVDVRAVGDTWFHTVQDQSRPTLFSLFGFGYGQYGPTERDAYTLVDARVGVQGEHWSIVAFGKNVFDEDYIEEAIPAPEFGGTFTHVGTQSRFGLEATYKF
ncbi:MAG: TonB-dependent receptor [Gammaproteobacteria bacterium]|nr:TonB-dependent receptor [Gammaproteobacteria bacterium]